MIALAVLGQLSIVRTGASHAPPSGTSTVRLAAPVVHRTAPHLRLSASVSPGTLTPGSRGKVVVDIAPRPGIHVYAPRSSSRPVSFRLEPADVFTVVQVFYPQPETYLFKPLNETMLVYSRPFSATVAFAVDGRRLQQARGLPDSTGALALEVAYQACDEEVCYLPEATRLEWKLR
jgi:hypothetical protein